jgi:hypothetical protein
VIALLIVYVCRLDFVICPNDVVLKAVSAPEIHTMSLIVIGFVALFGFARQRRTVGRD